MGMNAYHSFGEKLDEMIVIHLHLVSYVCTNIEQENKNYA